MPTWHSIYFLRASTGGTSFRFGVFGYTGTAARVGYRFPITYVSFLCSFSGIQINRLTGPVNWPPLLSIISPTPSSYIPLPPPYLLSPCCSASAVLSTIVRAQSSWRFALRWLHLSHWLRLFSTSCSSPSRGMNSASWDGLQNTAMPYG